MIFGKVEIDSSGLAAVGSVAKQRTITKRAVAAAARVVARRAKALAPKESGALKVAIGTKADKGRTGLTRSFAVVGARKKVVKMVVRKGRRTPTKAVPAFYEHLVEAGTKPHAVGKGALRKRHGKLPANQHGGVHPGAKAEPHLKPALDETKAEAGRVAVEIMAAGFEKERQRAAAKLARKGAR